jgi:hypothetical protein
MARSMKILAAALIAICCAGCGDAGAPLVSTRQSAPPKPAAPPSGEPAEKPVKPGSEVPAQFGGRQFVLLIGRPPITGNAGPGANGANVDPSAPSATQPAAGPPTPSGPTPPANTNPAPDASAPTTGASPPATRDASAPTTGATPPAANSPKPDDGTVEKAQPGVGAQGKGYGTPDAGLITTPIAAYFSAREQITFLIQIPENMNTFKAVNGRNPKSQEEFDREIIKAGGIKLPELPEGAKYVYDPEKGELTVVHPKPK